MIDIGEELTVFQAGALRLSELCATYVNGYGHTVDVYSVLTDVDDLALVEHIERMNVDGDYIDSVQYRLVPGWEFTEYVVRNGWHLVAVEDEEGCQSG
jgi:hypothetical protein